MLRLLVVAAWACSAALAAAAGASPEWARYSVLTPAGREQPDPSVLKGLAPLVYGTYTVQKGQVNMGPVAKAYGTSLAGLQATNGNELILLSPGMKIIMPNKDGMLYRVRKEGETLDAVLRRYRHDRAGFKTLKEKVIALNDLPGVAWLEPYELQPGDVLLIPGVHMEFDTYRFPFAAPGWHRISSGFGNRFHPILHYRRMHEGLDLPKPYGTPVYPARSGRVIHAGWAEGYGNMVEIRHTDGASTRYGHLSKVLVTDGQWVLRGKTMIGRVGNTGLSTGPHLHFEVRDRYGRAVNPRYKIGRR